MRTEETNDRCEHFISVVNGSNIMTLTLHLVAQGWVMRCVFLLFGKSRTR